MKDKPVNTFCNAPPVKRTINCSSEEVHEPEKARLEKHLLCFREKIEKTHRNKSSKLIQIMKEVLQIYEQMNTFENDRLLLNVDDILAKIAHKLTGNHFNNEKKGKDLFKTKHHVVADIPVSKMNETTPCVKTAEDNISNVDCIQLILEYGKQNCKKCFISHMPH